MQKSRNVQSVNKRCVAAATCLKARLLSSFHHQMEAQVEEQAAEAQKEKKLRERNEQYSRQLQEELEGLKVSVPSFNRSKY